MSTAATRRSRMGWLVDRPIAVKLGAVVALMGVVGILIAVVAVQGAHSLRDGEQRLYTQVVEPMVDLGEIQRSYQGDRVRTISYGTADAETRASLREDLEKRQANLQALLTKYDGNQADDEAWAALTTALTAYYNSTGQRLDASDAGKAPTLGFNDELPLSKAVMEPYATEAAAQAAAAAA